MIRVRCVKNATLDSACYNENREPKAEGSLRARRHGWESGRGLFAVLFLSLDVVLGSAYNVNKVFYISSLAAKDYEL